MNKKNIKNRLISMALVLQLIALSGCGKSVNNSNDGYNESVREANTHKVLKVDRNLDLFYGSEGMRGLVAPKGYKVLDYDYDYSDDFEYHDFVFINDEDVKIYNPNNIGTPVDINSREHSGKGIYQEGEHVIVDVDRTLELFWGKDNETIELVAPDGYEVIDFDYDLTGDLEFENITYKNTEAVSVEDINKFGKPVEEKTKVSKDYYDVGEHKLVTINRNLNLLFGKNEMVKIEAPAGYKIVDYDYDKCEDLEFETITYENIVPVKVEKKGFGKPIDPITKNYNKNLGVGEHVLVDINRNVDMGFGFEGTEELTSPDGYEILDYDYDKTSDFEFETTVYVNNKEVEITNENKFGRVVENNKTLSLK